MTIVLPDDHEVRMERARRSLDGLSVGDSFGQRFFAPPDEIRLWIGERLLPEGPWRWTDDTAMAMSIVEVLGRHGRIDQDALATRFAERYRAEPARGYGGMAHTILTLIGGGMEWHKAAGAAFGGMGSMGNGGGMRVAPLGAYFAGELEIAAAQARASAEITHSHREGAAGAVAVAVAAAHVAAVQESGERKSMLRAALEHTPDSETRDGISRAIELPDDAHVPEAVDALGNGSNVLAQDTVPFALWCAARCLGDFEAALWITASGLGDVDTTCAMVGGIVALSVDGLPPDWLERREPLTGA